jgi:hypothetical protein
VRAPKKARTYAPRLTASSYKYFIRGQGEKPSDTDVVVQARRRVHLKAYDKLLKKFECASQLSGRSLQKAPAARFLPPVEGFIVLVLVLENSVHVGALDKLSDGSRAARPRPTSNTICASYGSRS